MALSNDKKAMLKHLAAAGDLGAQEALYMESTGRAGLVSLGAPAAANAAGVVTTKYGDAATNPLAVAASPARPRNVTATFGATWDGGALTVVGTDQYGLPATEVLAANAGGATTGVKIFKTVTSVTKGAVGVGSHATNTVTVGWGVKLGLTVNAFDTLGLGMVNGTPEVVTVDPVVDGATFTSAPDGTKVFTLLLNY